MQTASVAKESAMLFSRLKLKSLTRVHFALTLAAIAAMLLWIFAWIFVWMFSGDDASALKGILMPLGPLAPAPTNAAGTLGFVYGMVQVCLLAPILEEACFRWTACAAAYDEHGKARGNWSRPIVLLVCGMLFGASHGFRYGFSYEMVIRMGMLGMILAALWVSLKRRGASAAVTLLCCILAHAAYNFTVTTAEVMVEKGKDEVKDACVELIKSLAAPEMHSSK